MGWPTDETLAKSMLEYREHGFTAWQFLRRSVKGYSQFIVILGSCTAVFAWLESHYLIPVPLAAISASFACGALLRDFAWFKILRRQWPFRDRTTDWDEVERIAAEGNP